MKLVDLNVLLYVINEDSAHHRRLLAWWQEALAGDEPIGLAWPVVLGFLRLTTHPAIFPAPLDTDSALATLAAWLELDTVLLVNEGDEQWNLLRSLLTETGTAGNLTTDAHLAALAISNGATLVSCDTDFARFRGLRWENPLD